jgi:hypothetical protein
MSVSKLTQTLLGSLLENPAVIEITSHALEKAVPIIKQHFTFTAEIYKAYQDIVILFHLWMLRPPTFIKPRRSDFQLI